MEEIIGRRIEEILTDEDAGRHPWTKALVDYFRSCQTRYDKKIVLFSSTYQINYLLRNQQDGREQMKRVLDKVVLSKTDQNE